MRNIKEIFSDIRSKLKALQAKVSQTEKQAAAFAEDRQVILDRAERLADLMVANHRIRPEQRKETIEKLACHAEALAMFWAAEKQRQAKSAANDIGFLVGGEDRPRGMIPSQDEIISRAHEAFKARLFS